MRPFGVAELGVRHKMTRIIQISFVILGLPLICFFLFMAIPVILFALPSTFIGNPLNGIFVLWWGLGGYAIYSTIYAILALNKIPYSLGIRHKIGMALGIISFLPLIPLSLSGEVGFGVTSKYIVPFSVLALIPTCSLLSYSLIKYRK